MSQERARRVVEEVVHLVAPGIDVDALDPAASLREQAGMDDLDFGELVALLSDAVRHTIPVADYPHLATIDAAVAYLAPQLPEPA